MRTFLCVLLLCPLFVLTAHAEGISQQAAELTGVDAVEEALPEEARQISGALVYDGGYNIQAAFKRLWRSFLETATEQLRGDLAAAATLVGIAVLCSMAGTLCAGKNVPSYIHVVGCAAAAMLIAGNLDSVISQATGALDQLSDYSKAAIPAIFAASAACGAVVSASAKYAAVCLAMDVLMSAAQRLVLPLVYAYVAISVCDSLFTNPLLKAAGRMTKWCATTAMTVLTLTFCAYITFTGLIAGSTDAVAVKTARTVISSTLPVVGGILSDAASVVLSAASVIKNTAGVFALIAVCALCAGPFAVLSVKILIFRGAAAAVDMLPGARLSTLLADVGNALGMLLGLVGCCGIMLFLSIMSGMKVVLP